MPRPGYCPLSTWELPRAPYRRNSGSKTTTTTTRPMSQPPTRSRTTAHSGRTLTTQSSPIRPTLAITNASTTSPIVPRRRCFLFATVAVSKLAVGEVDGCLRSGGCQSRDEPAPRTSHNWPSNSVPTVRIQATHSACGTKHALVSATDNPADRAAVSSSDQASCSAGERATD